MKMTVNSMTHDSVMEAMAQYIMRDNVTETLTVNSKRNAQQRHCNVTIDNILFTFQMTSLGTHNCYPVKIGEKSRAS